MNNNNSSNFLGERANRQSQRQADLKGRFGTVELPDTIEYGDQGQAQVIVTNSGNATARGPVTVKLYLSTDGTIDSNDVLLDTQTQRLRLKEGESTTFDFDYENITSAIAPGSYQIIAQIDSENRIAERHENNNTVSKLVSAPGTDVVVDWNATALNAIQAEGVAGRGIPPTLGSRDLAILHTAIYDTVNAFSQSHNPYAIDVDAPVGASIEAAVVGAAHRTLSLLIPEQTSLFSAQLVKSLSEIQDNPLDEAAGLRFGQSIADQILASRANDGFDNNAPYVPSIGDYVWQTDAPNFIAVGPNWGQNTLWAIPSLEEFAPDGLDGTLANDPELYAQEIEEVRLLGGLADTDVTTIVRTADQTELAVFWAYDRADTFRPYGQLNQITQEIAVREGTSLLDNARLFAALNVALADSGIVAWNEKYKFLQPRPDDVIAGGIAENDDLAATVSDPNWRPLLPTPPFPDYISGHSTFGGAWAGVLNEFFGENYEFSAVSQELPGVIRSFESFNEAAFEDAISRVYGGVHVREASVTDALPTGLNIGQFVAENFFQPIATV